MDELKSQLMDKLGVDEGMASSAIDMVLGFVKDKLPEGAQGMIDSVANGDDIAGGALDAVKGFFS